MISVMNALRASNYTIHVDLTNEPARIMLVHGSTGAYDLVSVDVAAYVRALDPNPPNPLTARGSTRHV
jgi:hypothetical protein